MSLPREYTDRRWVRRARELRNKGTSIADIASRFTTRPAVISEALRRLADWDRQRLDPRVVALLLDGKEVGVAAFEVFGTFDAILDIEASRVRYARYLREYGPDEVVIAWLDEHSETTTRALVGRRLRVPPTVVTEWTEEYGWQFRHRHAWRTAA